MDLFIWSLVLVVVLGVFALGRNLWLRETTRRRGELTGDTSFEIVVLPLVDSVLGPTWYVKYGYADAQGVEHHATSESFTGEPDDDVDGSGKVRYDPAHPERSAWVR